MIELSLFVSTSSVFNASRACGTDMFELGNSVESVNALMHESPSSTNVVPMSVETPSSSANAKS